MGTLRLPRGTTTTLNGRVGSEGELAFDTTTNRARTYSGGAGGEVLAYQSDFTPEAWNAITMQNGWVDFGLGYQTPRYIKNPAGAVYIEGMVKGGSIAVGTVLFNLPVGYRPANTCRVAALDNVGPVGLNLEPNGNVTCQSLSDNQWLSISLTFQASQ